MRELHTRILGNNVSNQDLKKLVAAYGDWLDELARERNAFMITVKFNELSGGELSKRMQMRREFERIVWWVTTPMVRHPYSENGWKQCPAGLACLDWPKTKKRKGKLRKADVKINDGMHVQGIFLKPKKTDLGMGLISFTKRYQKKLLGRFGKVQEVRFDRLTKTIPKATRYVLTSMRQRRIEPDDIWIFPKSRSEAGNKKVFRKSANSAKNDACDEA